MAESRKAAAFFDGVKAKKEGTDNEESEEYIPPAIQEYLSNSRKRYFVCSHCREKCPPPDENLSQDPFVILQAWTDHKEKTGHFASEVVYPDEA